MPWREDAEQALPPQRPKEPFTLRRDILDELEDHLALATEREQKRSDDGEDAVRGRVLKRFGDPGAVARQLWWDAMKETVMREWIQTAVVVVMAVAVISFTGMAFKQMQAGNEAIITALADMQGGDEAATMSSLVITVHRGSAGGVPAEGIEVSLVGKMFTKEENTLKERTDARGQVRIGPIRQGIYTVGLFDWDTALTLRRRDVSLLGGEKALDFIAADFERTRVNFDLGLPEYSNDEHQLVLAKLDWSWGEGENLWKGEGREALIGRSNGWFLPKVRQFNAPGRPKDDLGRLACTYAKARGEDKTLNITADHLTFNLNYGVVRTDQEGASSYGYITNSSLRDAPHLATMLGSMKFGYTQEWELANEEIRTITVALPDTFMDAFETEAVTYKVMTEQPELSPPIVAGIAGKYGNLSVESTSDLPSLGVVYALNGEYLRYNLNPEGYHNREIHGLARFEDSDGQECLHSETLYFPFPPESSTDENVPETRYVLVFYGKIESESRVDELVALCFRTVPERLPADREIKIINTDAGLRHVIESPGSEDVLQVDGEPVWRFSLKEGNEFHGWFQIDVTDLLITNMSEPLPVGIGLQFSGQDSKATRKLTVFQGEYNYAPKLYAFRPAS
jgi:hypothetical protein